MTENNIEDQKSINELLIEEELSNMSQKRMPANPKEVFKAFKKLNRRQIIQLSIVAVALFLFGFLNNYPKISLPEDIPLVSNSTATLKCYYDPFLYVTSKLNLYYSKSKDPKENLDPNKSLNPNKTPLDMLQNRHVYSFTLIVGGLLMDITVAGTMICWMLYATTWRFAVMYGAFYGIRGVFQSIITLRHPYNLSVRYPGFPSIFVNYLLASDYYFSGHVGGAVTALIENYWNKRYKFVAFCAVTAFWEAYIMVVTRWHYTIDLFVGAIFGHYIAMIARGWCERIYDKLPCEFLRNLQKKNIEDNRRIGVNLDEGEDENYLY